MAEYFPDVKKPIAYEGPDSKNPLAFKYYNPTEKVLGKTMAQHLRFAVCYWHTFRGTGVDMFGAQTLFRKFRQGSDEMTLAEQTLSAAFEFLQN
jgi:xylose isomerase